MAKFSGKNLTCIRRQSIVFEDLSFHCNYGQITALIGPNGSGKTSLLRMIAGLLEPISGTFSWDDEIIENCSLQEKVHWVGSENPLKKHLSVIENMRFWASALGGPDDDESILKALNKIDIAQLAATRTQYLSTGQIRRTNLCRLFLANRPIWLLDEPINGIDKQTAEKLKNLVNEHVKKDGIAIIATHRSEFWNAHTTLEIDKFCSSNKKEAA